MSGRRVTLLFSCRRFSGCSSTANTKSCYSTAQPSVAAIPGVTRAAPLHMTKTWSWSVQSSLCARWCSTSSGDLPPHSLVTLPSLSPTMETGTIVKWDKAVGDKLEDGDIIAQVETDKAVMDMETPGEGYLAKILVPEGTKDIPLGKKNEADLEAFKNYSPSDESTTPVPPQSPAKETPEQPPTGTTSREYPPHTTVVLPALSPTMDTGTIVKWDKAVGDKLEDGDIIAQVETDKAVMDMETPGEGYLAKILVPAGTKDIPLGKLLAIIVDDQSNIDSFSDYQPPSLDSAPDSAPDSTPDSTSVPPVKESDTVPSSHVTATPTSSPSGRIIASPYAKMVAREKGVNLQSVQGTGPFGRIVAQDVLSASEALPVSPRPLGVAYEDIPLTGMRKTIAARLVQSKQTIPHYYLSVDVNMSEVSRARSQINTTLKDLKLSYNDFIIKASALALKEVPQVNSQWMDSFIRKYNTVDISVAVSTEGGLITPIVTNADLKGLSSINSEVKSLAERARLGQLQPQEFQGGTFTISNLGMYGIKNFTAVINPPQSCILAVGKTEKRVIVDANDKFTAADVMSVTMSCDHRVVDGAVGAQWLAVFKSYLESPYRMLL